MKIDDEYDYNNFYNIRTDSNVYQNSESQSEIDNKNEVLKSLSLTNKVTLLNKIENDFLNEMNLNNNYFDKNPYFVNKNNYEDFSFIEENKNDLNGDEFLSINEKTIEHNKRKIKENESANIITIKKGRIIKTLNETVSNAINDLFPKKDEIDYDKMKDMQLLKTKRRRRTKKEIENEKETNKEKTKKNNPRGRRNKECQIYNYLESHSKLTDDNIIKKINTYFLKSINNWLNSSFIDEKGNFLSPKKKFLKINTKIFANLKKEKITKLMKTTFKEIFSKQISVKYKKYERDTNKKLIEEIYKENKQYFIKFILDLTFIKGLYIFDGEISNNNFKRLITDKDKNIEEKNINKFYNNFDKINSFLKKIYLQELNNYSINIIIDYVHRISLLCINYENWFDRKFNRNSKRNII